MNSSLTQSRSPGSPPTPQVRFLHDPSKAHGFVGAALSSNIIHFTKASRRRAGQSYLRQKSSPLPVSTMFLLTGPGWLDLKTATSNIYALAVAIPLILDCRRIWFEVCSTSQDHPHLHV